MCVNIMQHGLKDHTDAFKTSLTQFQIKTAHRDRMKGGFIMGFVLLLYISFS